MLSEVFGMHPYSLQSIDLPINFQVTFHHLSEALPPGMQVLLRSRALMTPIVMGTFGNLTCFFSVFQAIAPEYLSPIHSGANNRVSFP